MKKVSLVIAFLNLSVSTSAQEHQYFDPENKACAFAKQTSFKKFGHHLKPSGVEMDQKYHRFEWFVDPGVHYINGAVTSLHEMKTDSDQITFGLATELNVDSVLYHGQSVSFVHSGNVLNIQLPQTVCAGTLDSVSIPNQGVPPPGSGFGLFMHGYPAGIPIIWTLSQPYGCSD